MFERVGVVPLGLAFRQTVLAPVSGWGRGPASPRAARGTVPAGVAAPTSTSSLLPAGSVPSCGATLDFTCSEVFLADGRSGHRRRRVRAHRLDLRRCRCRRVLSISVVVARDLRRRRQPALPARQVTLRGAGAALRHRTATLRQRGPSRPGETLCPASSQHRGHLLAATVRDAARFTMPAATQGRRRETPLRILMISDVYFPRVSGVSTSIRTYRHDLQQMGHRCVLVAPEYPARETAVAPSRTTPT